MRNRKLISSFSLLFCSTVPLVFVQEAHSQSQSTPVLPEISVSATRTERETFVTPSSVTVIDSQEIELTQPVSFVDVLRNVPGVSVQGGVRRSAQVPVIRGFSDEQVVIRTDGARRNFNQIHRGRFPVDPEIIERVEVLRGPSSGLYGSGALGGVIAVETKSADDFLQGNGAGVRIGAAYRSNGEESSGLITAFGKSDSMDLLGSLVLRDMSDDLVDGGNEDILFTQDEVQSSFVKLGFAPVSGNRLELVVDDYNNSGVNPPNANEAVTPGVTGLVDRDTARNSIRLSWEQTKQQGLKAVLYSNDADVKESRLDRPREDETEFKTSGLDISNTNSFAGDSVLLTYGAEAYRDEQTGLRDGRPRVQFPNAEAEYLAAFVQGEFKISDRFDVIPAARFDSFNLDPESSEFIDRDEDAFSYSLGLGFSPGSNNYVWLKGAESFRAPSLTELYADGVHFVVPLAPGEIVINEFVSSPNLDSEESQSIEIGARQKFSNLGSGGGLLKLEASIFHNEVTNFIDQRVIFISGAPRFDPRSGSLVFPGQTVNVNVDATLQGAELSLDYQSDSWFGGASLSILDTELDDSSEGLASAPPDSLVLTFGRYLTSTDIALGGRLTLGAEQDDVPEGQPTSDSYTVLDLFGTWSPVEQLDIRFGVSNVLDEEYNIHPAVIKQAGESYNLSIAWQF